MKLTVKNMTCNHCVMTIQKGLMMKGIKADINLEEKSVMLKHESDAEEAKETMKALGYEVDR